MEIYLLILILFLFATIEFISTISFTNKIKMIDKKNFNKAALLGAFSTFLFMTLSLAAPIIADQNGAWFIFAAAGMMAIGNMLSLTFLLFWSKKISKKNKEAE